MKAVVLFSGGLDSTTMLRMVQELGYEVHAMTFSYGQRHSSEITAAKNIAKKYLLLELVSKLKICKNLTPRNLVKIYYR